MDIDYSIVKDSNANWQLKTEIPKSAHNHERTWLKNGCFSLNIQNIKIDGSLFSLRNIKMMKKMKILFLNFSADSLDSGPIFDNWENKSALLSLTIL